MTTTDLGIGASLESLLHSSAIHSFADMLRVAAAAVELDNIRTIVVVDVAPESSSLATVRPAK